jgi:dTMP kinase
MAKGLFVTFEGIEGSGKTTQIEVLEESLRLQGHEIVATREPGGTQVGDIIRRVLLNPEHQNLVPNAELLLYAAARAQHVAECIKPALAASKIVLCDRYCDATLAYQGGARGLPLKLIKQLNELATEGLTPQLTFLLDCPVEVGLKRARDRFRTKNGAEGGDRIEQEKLDFHQKVRQQYLNIAEAEPHRVVVIDATLDIDSLRQKISQEMQRFL